MEPNIDTTRANHARVYNFMLGGKDHFAIDRQTAEKILKSWPTVPTAARANRAFLGRAVRYLVSEVGIRQFLDIGTGLPSANNVHEVAQQVAPECRVVYVDNDPVVMAHARALLASSREGQTAYIQGDFREPEKILSDPATRRTLDFSQPIGLILVAVLHFVRDYEHPERHLATLVDALPSGSYVVGTHVTAEHNPEGLAGAGRAYQSGGLTGELRDSKDFADLAFHGLDLIDPGVVLVSEWRPDSDDPTRRPEEVNFYGGVARKP
ncbi:MAG TPA: SAM-dependent methyltransferase [Streptosporangiaceae bacterium]|nr:SAM-dependent methyltransferase [Streptosporangiaceae bacterium]